MFVFKLRYKRKINVSFMKKITLILTIILTINIHFAYADFTIGVMPDTQVLSETPQGAAMISAMTQFFADNKQTLNLVFVASLGDMTENGNSTTEWNRIKTSYNILKDAGIPFSPCQGNHDNANSLNNFFPVSDFSSSPYWGGAYNNSMLNSYFLFTVDKMDFLILTNQYTENAQATAWANSIYAQYPNRRAILANHDIAKNGWVLSNIISKNNNIFMGLCGHDTRMDGEEYWTSTSPNGNTQHLLMTDYQGRRDGGATVRYYTFKPDEDRIYAFTYNLTTKTYETDESSQFSFEYDMVPSVEASLAGVTVTPETASIGQGTRVQLTATVIPSNAINKKVTWSISDPNIATVSSTGLVTARAPGVVTITVTTEDGGKTATSTITSLDIPFPTFLDQCDATTGWTSSLKLNSTTQKEGAGCMEFTGSGSEEFRKVFNPTFYSPATATNGVLSFWYYVSDVSLLTTKNQVELGSGGRNDYLEYNWSLTGLVNGWNYIQFYTQNARTAGGVPDLTNINWFRLYNSDKKGIVTTRIDAIEFSTTTVSDNVEHTQNNIKIYPNPIESTLHISGLERLTEISVIKITGETALITKTLAEIDLSNIKPGIYFVKIKDRFVQRIIKS